MAPTCLALDSALARSGSDVPFETRRFGRPEGLQSGEIHAFEQTEDRFLWLGGEDGLIRFDGRVFENLGELRLGASGREPIESLARDADGYLFIGLQRSGLVRFKGGATFAVSRPASGDWQVSLLEERSDGVLWVAGPDQLWHLDRHGNSVKPALPGVGIRQLFTDPYGATWVAAHSGLFRRIGAAFQPVTLPYGRSAADARTLALDGQGNLWLAPANGGLWRLSGNFERGGLPQEIAPEPAFEGILVEHAITNRRGELWLATNRGVYHQSDQGLEKIPAIHEACGKIFEDLDGDIWIAARGGGLWQVYARRAPPALRPALALLATASSQTSTPTPPLELEAQTRNLELRLAAPFFAPDAVARFRWQLEGVDTGWQESREGIARYPRIAAGRHLFRAQATYGDEYQGEELRVEIVKEKAPWEEPLLWLAAICGAGLIAGLILHLRRIRLAASEDDDDTDDHEDEND